MRFVSPMRVRRLRYGAEGGEAMNAANREQTDMGKIRGIKGSFKHGGKVKSTGIYKLEKGEKVETKKQQKKALKR